MLKECSVEQWTAFSKPDATLPTMQFSHRDIAGGSLSGYVQFPLEPQTTFLTYTVPPLLL